MRDLYIEHPSKASRWHNGAFVVHDGAQHEDCTVWSHLETSDDGDARWEGLLGRRLARGRVRVCAIPVFTYDVGLDDEVAVVESGEGAPVATHVVGDGGNATFRVFFGDSLTEKVDDRLWRELMMDLEPLTCWFDVYSPGLVAVSAPPASARNVLAYLAARARRGELRFENGRTR